LAVRAPLLPMAQLPSRSLFILYSVLIVDAAAPAPPRSSSEKGKPPVAVPLTFQVG